MSQPNSPYYAASDSALHACFSIFQELTPPAIIRPKTLTNEIATCALLCVGAARNPRTFLFDISSRIGFIATFIFRYLFKLCFTFQTFRYFSELYPLSTKLHPPVNHDDHASHTYPCTTSHSHSCSDHHVYSFWSHDPGIMLDLSGYTCPIR